MKRVCLFMVSLFVMITSFGQSIDYNKIILPDNAKDISIEERLVQIAWRNNPASAISVNNVESGKYQLKKAQYAWLNHISIQGNLNEFTIQGRDSEDPTNRSNFYPRYNFGIGFTLGTFISTPLNNKIARESLQNDQEAQKQLKLSIRADVLRRYNNYKMGKELFDIQKEYYDNLAANFKLVEKKFNNGEITLNEYNNIKDRYDAQRIKKITADNSFQQAKLDLEELLGLKMEEIL